MLFHIFNLIMLIVWRIFIYRVIFIFVFFIIFLFIVFYLSYYFYFCILIVVFLSLFLLSIGLKAHSFWLKIQPKMAQDEA